MVKCKTPGCDTEIQMPNKEWDMTPPNPGSPILHLRYYKCPKCNKGFRIAEKIPRPIDGKLKP
jgi:hypothetical protein